MHHTTESCVCYPRRDVSKALSEAQLRATKEREGQFKDAQKQLQDLQDQLRATLDELRRIEESAAQLGE